MGLWGSMQAPCATILLVGYLDEDGLSVTYWGFYSDLGLWSPESITGNEWENAMQYKHGCRMDVSFLWLTLERRRSRLCLGAGEA